MSDASEPPIRPEPAAGSGPRRPPRAVLIGALVLLTLLAFAGGWALGRSGGASDRPGRSAAAVREAAVAAAASQAMEARVARLETEGALVARVAAAGLAVMNLETATETGGGFAAALAAAERVLPASPDLQALRPLAEQGAPSRAVLVAAFPNVAARVRAAAGTSVRADPALGGFGRALDRLFGRPEPQPRAPAPEDPLARAEGRLAAGDLPGAVAALDALPPAARPRVVGWSAAARRRAEIDARLAAVRLLALNQFAAPGTTEPGAARP